MPITIEEVIATVDPLFLGQDQRQVAFENTAFRDELTRAISYVNSGASLDAEYFNRILIAGNLGPIAPSLYAHYFPRGINSAEKLREGLETFMKDALMHFGSFHQAFLRMKADFNLLPKVQQVFGSETRAPFDLSQPLKVEELAFLGYVSGELPVQMDNAHKAILSALGQVPAGQVTAEAIKDAAKNQGVDIEKELAALNDGLKRRKSRQITLEEFSTSQAVVKKSIDEFVEEVKRCRRAGIKNQEQYINSAAEMDVYIATSMRDERDYREMNSFIDQVFGRRDIERLHLRYFDPTQAYCPNKYDKGLVECLMIRCAKVTIYCAQRQDTMGKDSELAITLGLGKPVIVYVPRGDTEEDRLLYDKRARTFADVHPLSLQVNQATGNTNGIILVRDANQCADVLYAIAKNQLAVTVTRQEEADRLSGEKTICWVLREAVTGNNSVIRVATGWKHLRTAFWSAFRPDLHIP